ncbi:MAG: hypothetical protein ABW318_22965 [Vicinamibacterales bacterium]
MQLAEAPLAKPVSGTYKRSLSSALMGTALLVGCAGDGPFKPPPSPEPLQIEAGSRFTLRVPLMFSAGTTALYFQDNQLVSPAGIARQLPYCKLTPASGATPQVIEPVTFAVLSVDYDEKQIASTGQLANVTRIELAANPTQPYTLSCQWPPGAPSRSFLTSEEIQGAIGAHFSMALQR